MTYVIAEPCIEQRHRICPVTAIFPEDALPEKWLPFLRINAAWKDGSAKAVAAALAAHGSSGG